MSDYDGTIIFKDWLPDQPDLNNPGLIEAKNVLPVAGSYRSFKSLTALASSTLGSQPLGAFYPLTGSGTITAAITNVVDGIVGSTAYRTITTSGAHGFSVGDVITISGVAATGTFQVNGTWTILQVPNSTSFRLIGSGDPSGSYSSGGTASRDYVSALVAGTETKLFAYESGAWVDRSSGTTYNSATSWEFASYNTKVMALNGVNVPQVQLTPNAGFTQLASSGTAPPAWAIGVVNQFAVIGDTTDAEYALQWSAIDDVRNWPTPGSTTAIASQSGRQYLPSECGAVRSIHGGDQHGVVLQQSGVTRMTYAGPPTVFSFDTISKTHGAAFPKSSININGLVHFISTQGFCLTDGVSVVPIGDGQVDRYFLDNVNPGYAHKVRAAHYKPLKLIYWCWPDLTATNAQPNQVIAYHYEQKRWSRATQVCDLVFSPAATEVVLEPWGFDSTHCLGTFTGTPGTAVITTGETEPNSGGFSRMGGIKPLIDTTVNAVTVAMGTRNDRSSAVTFTSEITAHSRTGFANFRSEARYHRARLTITGTFNAAQGLEYQATPSGYT